MVTVTGYAQRQRKDGTSFFVLELNGGLELVQSLTTGKFYATSKKCTMPSTFDETTAELMIGEKVDGEIVRINCEPYEYVNKRTGEVLKLSHSFAYRPKGAIELVGETKVEIPEFATA
jgi:hypothetical protein